MAEQVILAPAAGAGIGKLFAEQLLARPDFIPAMVEAAVGGLTATRSFWAKDEGLVTEPDQRTRIQALALILANMEGEPVKRIIHQHLGPGGAIDLEGILADSPELREAMKRKLDNAEWRKSGRNKAKKAEPVDGETVPSKPIS